MVGTGVCCCYLVLTFFGALTRSGLVAAADDPSKFIQIDEEAVLSSKLVTAYDVETNATVATDVTRPMDVVATTKSPFVIERSHLRTLRKKPAQVASPSSSTSKTTQPPATSTSPRSVTSPSSQRTTLKSAVKVTVRTAAPTTRTTSTSTTSRAAVVQTGRVGWPASNNWRSWASSNVRRLGTRIQSNWGSEDRFGIKPW